ncbi:Na+/H+ antiporter subunit E [Gulosibacter sp. ACHW.36C]|uniref:Na+/H+ antiporter subunit E n=1 Tax=Gulosibacter sediminis TaxID=1729695 RepID=A0ABY4MXW5_9MICO|nr:Na+/H+ antiporter subunit E [Gulosibacter sediminis]UQN15276.1 Na+/H+ antiporter subunit E [Gulosibacter sediminis]
MSADPHIRAERLQRPGVALLTQLPLLIGLVVLWIVLWGHLDVISLVTGVVFSLIVVRLFSLPPVLLSGRIHVWYTIVLLAKFFWWLIGSTFQMAWLAMRPKAVPQASILAVRMRVHSDWLLTLTAEINMLVPGSVVVEVDRLRSILYLHVLDADTDEKIQRARLAAEQIEDAIVVALGNHEDIALINDDRRLHDRPPLFASREQQSYEVLREADRKAREAEWEAEL